MPFVPALNVLQCETRWTYLGQQVENVTYWRTTGVPTPENAADLYMEFEAAFVAHTMTLTSNQMLFREMYLTDLSSETAPTYTVLPEEPLAGTANTTPLPSSVALCISFRTNGRGRSARGRNYAMGVTEAHVDGNLFLSSWVNGQLDFYNRWRNQSAASSLQQVVISRISEGVERAEAFVQPVTAILVVDSVVDSQRRRLLGRGA